jgi:predicted ArsR family transcriptional regulator
LPARAGGVLEALLYRGQLPRGEVSNVLGITDRQARRIIAVLMARNVAAARLYDAQVLTADGPLARAPRLGVVIENVRL